MSGPDMMAFRMLFVPIFSGVWCLIGVIFCAVGWGLRHSRQRRIARCTERTQGTVIDLVRRVGGSGGSYGVSWHPVFSYFVGDQQAVKESNYGASQAKFMIGQPVTVFYDPRDPNTYIVQEEKLGGLLSRVFLIIGTVALLVGVVVGLCVWYLA